jgi:hypothetical protein
MGSPRWPATSRRFRKHPVREIAHELIIIPRSPAAQICDGTPGVNFRFCRRPSGVRHWPRPSGSASSTTRSCRCLCLVKAQADYTLSSVVPDIARIGIDHGEEDADALPVLLHRPIRCPARPESVALVRPAQSVVGGAAVSSSANGEPFALDVEGEQHRPGPSLCSAVRSWNGGGTLPSPLGLLFTRASIHGRRLGRPSHTRSADSLICHSLHST